MDYYESVKRFRLLLEDMTLDTLSDSVYKLIVKEKTNLQTPLQDLLYSYLTGGAQTLSGAAFRKHNIGKDKDKFEQYQNKYQQIKKKWKYEPWSYEQTTSWEFFHHPQHDERVKKKSNHNLKRYITLSEPKSQSLGNFDKLLQNLTDIPSVFSVKIPLTVDKMIDGVDNIIIYFLDKSDMNEIDNAIKKSGIDEEDRSKFHRSKFGVDRPDEGGTNRSDTEHVAKYVAQEFRKWLNQIIKETGKHIGNHLIEMKDKEEAKRHIKKSLEVILKRNQPHRNT